MGVTGFGLQDAGCALQVVQFSPTALHRPRVGGCGDWQLTASLAPTVGRGYGYQPGAASPRPKWRPCSVSVSSNRVQLETSLLDRRLVRASFSRQSFIPPTQAFHPASRNLHPASRIPQPATRNTQPSSLTTPAPPDRVPSAEGPIRICRHGHHVPKPQSTNRQRRVPG